MAVVGVVFMLFVLFFPRGIWGSTAALDRPPAGRARSRIPGARRDRKEAT
jgi:hypothetical protein